jgi:hypothetical protein
MTTAQTVKKAKAEFLAANKARLEFFKRTDARCVRALRRLHALGYSVEHDVSAANRIVKNARV